MMKDALVYLHGFNSASLDVNGNILQSKSKLRILSRFCKENGYKFLAPNLDYQNPAKVVEQLRDIMNKLDKGGNNVNFIGTSLGGFFAEYMAMITNESAIMINPATKPSGTLSRYIGKCKNYVTNEEYTWTQANCYAFKIYEEDFFHFPYGEIGRTVLLDMGDELLNSSETIRKYKGKVALHTFEGGSHRFDHLQEALPMIKDSVNSIFMPYDD